MIGSLFAGTDEAPGEVFLSNGCTYKSYRGMGSIAAMGRGSADRYFQEEILSIDKFVPEGVEGRVLQRAFRKSNRTINWRIKSINGLYWEQIYYRFQENTKLIKITSAGLNESHVHGISITRESPNYQINNENKQF